MTITGAEKNIIGLVESGHESAPILLNILRYNDKGVLNYSKEISAKSIYFSCFQRLDLTLYYSLFDRYPRIELLASTNGSKGKIENKIGVSQ